MPATSDEYVVSRRTGQALRHGDKILVDLAGLKVVEIQGPFVDPDRVLVKHGTMIPSTQWVSAYAADLEIFHIASGGTTTSLVLVGGPKDEGTGVDIIAWTTDPRFKSWTRMSLCYIGSTPTIIFDYPEESPQILTFHTDAAAQEHYRTVENLWNGNSS